MAIKIGTAPDSWGVWFPQNDKQTTWQRCMDEMQKAGYEYIELGPWGYFPTDLMTGELVMPKELTEVQWKQLYKNVQKVCDHMRSYSLVPTLHPHVNCYIQTEEEIERLLANTDVPLCLDTGHHVYGGGDPISFYKKHHNRIPYLHIKECDMNVKKEMDKNGWSFAKAVTKDIMCEPGKGSIDFKELFNFMNEIGYDGYAVVEQDMYPVTSFDVPFPIAKRTRDYLKSLGV